MYSLLQSAVSLKVRRPMTFRFQCILCDLTASKTLVLIFFTGTTVVVPA
jgi:hypothetical protein